jgi:hypothetical protein
MSFRFVGLGSAVLLSLFSAGSASAQRVSADIRIGGRGPISGRVRIESRDRYRDRYSRDYGYRPRQVRVEVIHRSDRRFDRGGRFYDWNRFSRNARVVVVYYDREDDCYYDREFYPGLQEIRVLEDDGQFYRFDDGYNGYNRGSNNRGYDDRRYDDRRYDNRGYDGRDGRGWDPRNDSRDPRNGSRDGRNRDPRSWDPRDGRDH